MQNEEQKFKEKVFKLIDDKRVEFEKYSDDHLSLVNRDINKLYAYLNCKLELTTEDINDLLSNLIQYRIYLDLPIDKGVCLVRATKIDDYDDYPNYNDVSRVSYIPLHLKKIVKMGRFNKNYQSMYYGSLFDSYSDINVPFNEIDVQHGEYINLLISQIRKDLNIQLIGLFHYYEYDQKKIIPIHNIVKEIYKYYEDTHSNNLLLAIKKADEFLFKLSRHDSDNKVYKLTSTLGNLLFKNNNSTDGILYPSVKVDGEPNIVLKPNVVDDKIEHIESKLSLSYFNEKEKTMDAKEFMNGKIVNCKILWK